MPEGDDDGGQKPEHFVKIYGQVLRIVAPLMWENTQRAVKNQEKCGIFGK